MYSNANINLIQFKQNTLSIKMKRERLVKMLNQYSLK